MDFYLTTSASTFPCFQITEYISQFDHCINFIQLGVALGTHILGIILAIVGLSIAAALWSILNSTCVQTGGGFYLIASDRCHCTLNNELYQCKSFIIIFIIFPIYDQNVDDF